MMKSKMTDIDRLVASLDSANKIADKYNHILSTIFDMEKDFKLHHELTDYWRGVRDTLDKIVDSILEK